MYKSGTGTSGRVCGDLGLGDARRGTLEHQVWDAGTSNTGTQGTRDVNNYCKDRGKFDISHFPREYVLVKATHPALRMGFLHSCLRSEDSAKTPCIEESETVVLVFLLMGYWSPKQGRVGCDRHLSPRLQSFCCPPQINKLRDYI